MELKDKTAIITGAAKGIGKAIAKKLISDDFFVIAVDVDEKSGKKLIAEFGKDKMSFAKANICKEKVIETLFDKILKKYK